MGDLRYDLRDPRTTDALSQARGTTEKLDLAGSET